MKRKNYDEKIKNISFSSDLELNFSNSYKKRKCDQKTIDLDYKPIVIYNFKSSIFNFSSKNKKCNYVCEVELNKKNENLSNKVKNFLCETKNKNKNSRESTETIFIKMFKKYNFDPCKFLCLIAPYYIFTIQDYMTLILINKEIKKEVPKLIEIFKSNLLPENIKCPVVSMKILCKMKFNFDPQKYNANGSLNKYRSKNNDLEQKKQLKTNNESPNSSSINNNRKSFKKYNCVVNKNQIYKNHGNFNRAVNNIRVLHLYNSETVCSNIFCDCMPQTDQVMSTFNFLKNVRNLKTLILQNVIVTPVTLTNYLNENTNYIIFISCVVSDTDVWQDKNKILNGKKLIFIMCSISGSLKNTLFIKTNRKTKNIFCRYFKRGEIKSSFYNQKQNDIMMVMVGEFKRDFDVKINKDKKLSQWSLKKSHLKFVRSSSVIKNFDESDDKIKDMVKINLMEIFKDDFLKEIKRAIYLSVNTNIYKSYNVFFHKIKKNIY